MASRRRATWFVGFLLILFGFIEVFSEDVTQQRLALRQLAVRAAEGDAKALYDLATLHDTGYDSIPIDTVRSTLLYRLSAEKGYAPARNYLGFRYFNGEGVTQNVDSALYWLTKAAAAGDPKAANNLGYLLSNSDKVTRDYPQAIMWLTKAAEAGVPTGQSLLADLLRQGLGTEPDSLRAMALYDAAIDGGLHDAELKLLAMMGNKWQNLSADSAVSLGRRYFNRHAPIIAATLYEIGAEEGNADAMALLGDLYSRGLGVEYNHDKSVAYFLEAALHGQPSAAFIVGELIDIFPDAVSTEENSAIIKDFLTDSNVDETLWNDLISEMRRAQYWYEMAASAGITDGESAYKALLLQ